MGETLEDGTLDLQNAWKEYGQNLDWKLTDPADESSRSCDPIAGGDIVTDGNEGRDNSFGQNILPILREYFPNDPDMLTVTANEMITTGTSTYLFKLEKIDPVNCYDVTNDVYRGSNMLSSPVFTSADLWPIDPTSLKMRLDDG